MVPDIDYFLKEPLFRGAAWADIFFFHHSLDKVLSETDLFFAAEFLLLFFAVNLFAMARTVQSFKRLNEALFGKEEEEEEGEGEQGKEKKEAGEEEEAGEKPGEVDDGVKLE